MILYPTDDEIEALNNALISTDVLIYKRVYKEALLGSQYAVDILNARMKEWASIKLNELIGEKINETILG